MGLVYYYKEKSDEILQVKTVTIRMRDGYRMKALLYIPRELSDISPMILFFMEEGLYTKRRPIIFGWRGDLPRTADGYGI